MKKNFLSLFVFVILVLFGIMDGSVLLAANSTIVSPTKAISITANKLPTSVVRESYTQLSKKSDFVIQQYNFGDEPAYYHGVSLGEKTWPLFFSSEDFMKAFGSEGYSNFKLIHVFHNGTWLADAYKPDDDTGTFFLVTFLGNGKIQFDPLWNYPSSRYMYKFYVSPSEDAIYFQFEHGDSRSLSTLFRYDMKKRKAEKIVDFKQSEYILGLKNKTTLVVLAFESSSGCRYGTIEEIDVVRKKISVKRRVSEISGNSVCNKQGKSSHMAFWSQEGYIVRESVYDKQKHESHTRLIAYNLFSQRLGILGEYTDSFDGKEYHTTDTYIGGEIKWKDKYIYFVQGGDSKSGKLFRFSVSSPRKSEFLGDLKCVVSQCLIQEATITEKGLMYLDESSNKDKNDGYYWFDFNKKTSEKFMTLPYGSPWYIEFLPIR